MVELYQRHGRSEYCKGGTKGGEVCNECLGLGLIPTEYTSSLTSKKGLPVSSQTTYFNISYVQNGGIRRLNCWGCNTEQYQDGWIRWYYEINYLGLVNGEYETERQTDYWINDYLCYACYSKWQQAFERYKAAGGKTSWGKPMKPVKCTNCEAGTTKEALCKHNKLDPHYASIIDK